MNFVIGGAFIVVAFLIVKQISILRNECKKSKESGFDFSRYSDRINKIGEGAMYAIEKGTVKKQLLPNDALKHDSNKTLEQYIKFINHSSVYEYVISLKERSYNG